MLSEKNFWYEYIFLIPRWLIFFKATFDWIGIVKISDLVFSESLAKFLYEVLLEKTILFSDIFAELAVAV